MTNHNYVFTLRCDRKMGAGINRLAHERRMSMNALVKSLVAAALKESGVYEQIESEQQKPADK